MSQQYVCPQCGESTNVDVMPFLDEEGRSKVRLTCRLIVHEEPVIQEFDDPNVPQASQLSAGDGLVHQLDLYEKLEAIVLRLERPVEYGIVEHLFAYEHPDDYVTMWRRWGHVATHRSKRYTVSSYLGKLLGTLARHGVVTYLPYQGTGRWAYDSDLSAWANPSRADGQIQSWVDFAQQQGFSRDDWPATELLPHDELPAHGPSGDYWIYDNRVHHYTRIHRAECSYCNAGDGIHADADDVAGEWSGPFASHDDALAAAHRTGRDVSNCRSCSN